MLQRRVERASTSRRACRRLVERYADYFDLQPFSPEQIATIADIPDAAAVPRCRAPTMP